MMSPTILLKRSSDGLGIGAQFGNRRDGCQRRADESLNSLALAVFCGSVDSSKVATVSVGTVAALAVKCPSAVKAYHFMWDPVLAHNLPTQTVRW